MIENPLLLTPAEASKKRDLSGVARIVASRIITSKAPMPTRHKSAPSRSCGRIGGTAARP